jgi:hypothetical protein
MHAFITFCRQNVKQNNLTEIHLLGIKNPKNIGVLDKFNLRSGQPVVCVIESSQIVAFYLIANNGELFQVYGVILLLLLQSKSYQRLLLILNNIQSFLFMG